MRRIPMRRFSSVLRAACALPVTWTRSATTLLLSSRSCRRRASALVLLGSGQIGNPLTIFGIFVDANAVEPMSLIVERHRRDGREQRQLSFAINRRSGRIACRIGCLLIAQLTSCGLTFALR